MILVVGKKDNSKMYEEVRSVNTNDKYLVYYRKDFYPGEASKINIDEIDDAYILANEKMIHVL